MIYPIFFPQPLDYGVNTPYLEKEGAKLAHFLGKTLSKGALMKYANIITVRLVKEARVPTVTVSSPADLAAFVRPLYADYPYEVFGVVLLNSANKVTGFSIVTTGILNSSLVHPREVFQRALLNNAAGVILVHNHPSGSLEPSGEDIRITRQLVEAGRILGIPVHDHVIITPDGGSVSFAERGLL